MKIKYAEFDLHSNWGQNSHFSHVCGKIGNNNCRPQFDVLFATG